MTTEKTETRKPTPTITVRRIHRRDLNRTWEFLKLVFRDVNRETVEYQRPRTKRRFLEVYEEEGIEQVLFEVGDDVVGYVECAFEATGDESRTMGLSAFGSDRYLDATRSVLQRHGGLWFFDESYVISRKRD